LYERQFNRDWLFIGDVLAGNLVADIRLPNLRSEPFTLTTSQNKQYTVREVWSRDFCVYMSHECDFNDDKRQNFLVAPLLSIPANIARNPDELTKLKKSNDVAQSGHYLNYFFYESHEAILTADMLVDFTRIQYVPSNLRDTLLNSKRMELDTQSRSLLKDKLGFYFAH